MKVCLIKISNILGINELEIKPGGYTEISGANGVGKSSVLEAIRAAVTGGKDATLLRNGAAKGEIVLVLEDGTEIKKRITESGASVDVSRGEMKVMKPAEHIKALVDLLSVNPVAFLNAPEKERVQVLLEAMPIVVDKERLAGWDTGGPPPAGLDGLDLVEHVRKNIYDERTLLNRESKSKRATAQQLRDGLPSEEAIPDTAELESRQAAIDTAKDQKFAAIDAKLKGLRDERDAEVAKLRKQIEEINAVIATLNAGFAEQERKAEVARSEAISAHASARNEINTQLAAINEKRQAAARAAQARETVAKMDQEAERLERRSEKCTNDLASLESYKSVLLAKLPIPGLEVRDGKIYRNGVSFDRLNTATRVTIAVDIAKLRAGPLKLICVDDIEHLDEETYAEFRKQAEASGLQFIVSKVSSGPMKISTNV